MKRKTASECLNNQIFTRTTVQQRAWLELHTDMSATVRKCIDLARVDYPDGLPGMKTNPVSERGVCIADPDTYMYCPNQSECTALDNFTKCEFYVSSIDEAVSKYGMKKIWKEAQS